MIRFLLQRPIAVLMAFTACFIVGLVTYFTIPVSLLPDIAIPEITVQISGQNTSARELENTVVKPVRLQLMQVAGLSIARLVMERVLSALASTLARTRILPL